METVASILSRKGRPFNVVHPDCPLRTALHQMNCQSVEYLIVVNEDQFSGIITEHDIATGMATALLDMDKACVRDFLCTNIPIITEEDSIVYAMQIMDMHNMQYVAVYDDLLFRGVISAMDILKQTLCKRKAIFEEEFSDHAYPWNY